MLRRGLACLLLLLLLTGCWNRQELNDIGAVIGMAVDKGEQAPVRLTLYVARAYGSTKGGDPRWVVTREGVTIPDAMRSAARASSRRISLRHVRVILIGEEYARSGMGELLDFTARNPEIRMTARPLVVKGRAQPVLQTPAELEAFQPENLVKILEARGGLDPKLKAVLVAINSETHSSWMYAVSVINNPAANPGAPKQAVVLSGLALFRKDRLVDLLGTKEAQLFGWLLQNPRRAEFSLPCAGEHGKSIAFRVEEGKAKIAPSVVNNQPSFLVTIRTRIYLTELQCAKSEVIDRAQRRSIEQLVEADLTQRLTALTKRLQGERVDPVGFGKHLQLKNPALWRQLEKGWPELWSGAPVRYSVRVTIHHAGMVMEPANRSRLQLRGTE